MGKLYVICGHGAGDPGACAHGRKEADDVRRLGNRIKELGGSSVVLLDTSRDWYADAGILNLDISKSDWIVELHRDSTEGARGGHVIIKSGIGGADKYDKALASLMGRIFPGRAQTIREVSNLANPNRAASKGFNYRLVENGFITSEEDNKIFDSRLDDLVEGYLAAFGLKASEPKPSASKPASTKPKDGIYTGTGFGGTYRCNCSALNVRAEPSTSAAVVATYKRGQIVILDDWYKISGGYVWGRYTGATSGKKRYVAVGKATGKVESNDYLLKI